MSIVLLLEIIGGLGVEGGDRWVEGLSILGCGCGGQGVGIIFQFLFFSCALVFCILLSPFSVPLLRWLGNDGCCVCFFVFLHFFCLWSL